MTRLLLAGTAALALSTGSALAGGLAPAIVQPQALSLVEQPNCPVIPSALASLQSQGISVGQIVIRGDMAEFQTSSGGIMFECTPNLALVEDRPNVRIGSRLDDDGIEDRRVAGVEAVDVSRGGGGGGDGDGDGIPNAADPDDDNDDNPDATDPDDDNDGIPDEDEIKEDEIKEDDNNGGPQGNNGCGNGDQRAPGNSGPNNNAENQGATDDNNPFQGECPDQGFDNAGNNGNGKGPNFED